MDLPKMKTVITEIINLTEKFTTDYTKIKDNQKTRSGSKETAQNAGGTGGREENVRG